MLQGGFPDPSDTGAGVVAGTGAGVVAGTGAGVVAGTGAGVAKIGAGVARMGAGVARMGAGVAKIGAGVATDSDGAKISQPHSPTNVVTTGQNCSSIKPRSPARSKAPQETGSETIGSTTALRIVTRPPSGPQTLHGGWPGDGGTGDVSCPSTATTVVNARRDPTETLIVVAAVVVLVVVTLVATVDAFLHVF